MEGTIGEIRMFAPDFAPKFWQLCQGQILAINTNTPLFAILGTTFGGNGTTTFALPDTRGRVAVGTGQGPGLPNIPLGQQTGTETTTLTANNLPAHNHTVNGTITMPTTSTAANAATPANNYFANDGTTKFDQQNDNATMKPANLGLVVGPAGNGQGVNNMVPYLAINYIICILGVFPSRN